MLYSGEDPSNMDTVPSDIMDANFGLDPVLEISDDDCEPSYTATLADEEPHQPPMHEPKGLTEVINDPSPCPEVMPPKSPEKEALISQAALQPSFEAPVQEETEQLPELPRNEAPTTLVSTPIKTVDAALSKNDDHQPILDTPEFDVLNFQAQSK